MNYKELILEKSFLLGREIVRRESRSRSPKHHSENRPPSSNSLTSTQESTKHQHQHQHIHQHQHQHSHQHQHFHPPFSSMMPPTDVFPPSVSIVFEFISSLHFIHHAAEWFFYWGIPSLNIYNSFYIFETPFKTFCLLRVFLLLISLLPFHSLVGFW